MHDPNFIGAEFDYEEISKMIGSEKSYALGAGSSAMSCLDGHCGELVINENLITNESRSIIARVSPDKKCIVEKYSARKHGGCLLYTSPSPRDKRQSRMPSSA